jgi:hypothetical protein
MDIQRRSVEISKIEALGKRIKQWFPISGTEKRYCMKRSNNVDYKRKILEHKGTREYRWTE